MSYLATKRRRDLLRRKWQYGAAAVTIFLGVMMFATSYDAYLNLNASYNGTYERLAFADMTVTGAADTFANRAKGLDGVAEVATRTQVDIPMRVGDKQFIGRMVGMPPDEQPAVNKLDMQDGDYLASGAPDEVVAEVHMADAFSLASGDTVEYFDGQQWRKLTLRGTAISAEYIWPARSSQEIFSSAQDFGVLFVAEDLAQAMPAPLQKQQTLVLYDQGADRASVDDAVGSLARSEGASAWVARADQPSNKALSLDVMGFEQMAYAFPALFLLAAGMATYTLLTRLVYREREIIGTLRANGLSGAEVVRHYLGYGLMLGIGAAVLGVAAGVPLGWATTFLYTAELGIPDTVRQFHWVTPVIGIVFGVVVGFLSGWVPARSAARLDPAEAMRGDVPVARGHRSLLEAIFPPVRRLPVRWRMVLRGIGRNKRRSFSTVLGVVLALVLILASWGLIDTMDVLLYRQFNDIQLEDVTAVWDTPVDDARVAEVDDVDGVAAAERVYVLGVSAQGPDGTYETQLMGFEADTSMHKFAGGGLPADGVVLGTSLRDLLGVEVGDDVTLSFTGLDAKIDAKVREFVEEPLGTFVYMRSDALVSALAGSSAAISGERLSMPDASVVMARYDAGVDRQKVTDAIAGLEGVAAVTDQRSLFLQIQQYMGLFYAFVGIMLAFGGTMAFTLIFNTMSVNLAERSGEFASMRANGMSRSGIASLVMGENLLLTMIGIPFGLVLGYWAADAMMASYSSDLFVFPLYIKPTTYVLSAVAMIVVTLISLWPGIRAAGRMDIGSVVRQRAV